MTNEFAGMTSVMRQLERILFFGLGLALLSACSLSGPMREDAIAEGYTVGTLNRNWELLHSKSEADQAWHHPKTGAVIALQSLCHRYEHVPLKILNQNVMSSLLNPVVISQEEIKLDQRSALDTLTQGELDGVLVEIRHVVLRKDHCIFDFTLTQVNQISKSHQEEFSKFVNGFRFSGGAKVP